MSKSLGNGIYLADDMDTLKKKVMSMYTDPDHIKVEDPGKIEGNMVFHYLDVFGREEDATTIAEMKEHYQAGGLGDVKLNAIYWIFSTVNSLQFVNAASNSLKTWALFMICFKRALKKHALLLQIPYLK